MFAWEKWVPNVVTDQSELALRISTITNYSASDSPSPFIVGVRAPFTVGVSERSGTDTTAC